MQRKKLLKQKGKQSAFKAPSEPMDTVPDKPSLPVNPDDTSSPEIVVPLTVTPSLASKVKKLKKSGYGIIGSKMVRVQWKKGQSGNPKGRPRKGFTIPEMLRQIGSEEIVAYDRDGKQVKMTRHEFVMRQAYLAAEAGDKDFVKFIAERTEGKIANTINLNSGQNEQQQISNRLREDADSLIKLDTAAN